MKTNNNVCLSLTINTCLHIYVLSLSLNNFAMNGILYCVRLWKHDNSLKSLAPYWPGKWLWRYICFHLQVVITQKHKKWCPLSPPAGWKGYVSLRTGSDRNQTDSRHLHIDMVSSLKALWYQHEWENSKHAAQTIVLWTNINQWLVFMIPCKIVR